MTVYFFRTLKSIFDNFSLPLVKNRWFGSMLLTSITFCQVMTLPIYPKDLYSTSGYDFYFVPCPERSSLRHRREQTLLASKISCLCPPLRTNTRSAIDRISGIRWVMSKIESPISFRFLIRPSNLLASVTPKAAVGSSMIRTFD